MKLRRIWGIIAVSLSTVLLTSGCIKLEMDMTVATDDTVSGDMVFAISKSLAEMGAEEAESESASTPETDNLFADAENVTIEPFDDGEFVGSSYSFEGLPLTQFAPKVGDSSALAIERQGDNLVISGVLDTSAEGEELEENPFADSIMAGFAASTSIRVSITLPGEIIETNGQIDGQTITWKGAFGQKLDLQAVAVSPVSTPISWILVVGIAGILLGLGGVTFAVIMGRRKQLSPKTESGTKDSKESKPKKQTKAEILAAKALAARPWYQKKRFAFPAIGLFVLSFLAIAIGLMQPKAGTTSADSSSPSSSPSESSEVEEGKEDSGASGSNQPAVTQPAPQAAPAEEASKAPVAAPSGREAPALEVSPSETELQFYARQDALTFWSENLTSRTGLINWLVDGWGYSYEDAVYGTDSLGVDWYIEASAMANTLISEYFYSRLALIMDLELEGFSTDEAVWGVDNWAYDWYDEAYYRAWDLIQEQGYTEQEAYDQMISELYTAEEVDYGTYWAAQG
jgi:hypothetical protein